ncbi:MAG: hypothetical protein V1655_00020 [bacterium]
MNHELVSVEIVVTNRPVGVSQSGCLNGGFYYYFNSNELGIMKHESYFMNYEA